MKKRVLFSACILAACLGACTNDDFENVQQQGNTAGEANEVVGAVLASKGMKVNVVGKEGSADTRATNGAWVEGDRFGLGWFNIASSIDAEQSLSIFESPVERWAKDSKIYANHLFLYDSQEAQFYTYADVYEGAYFAYFPYARRGETSVKEISANGEMQTEDYMTERYNKALHLSGLEYITPDDAMEGDMLEKDLFISPVVNALGVLAKPDDEEMQKSPWLQKMQITNMKIYTGDGTQVFVSDGTLVPRYIPKAVYTITGELDTDATRQELDDAAAKVGGASGDFLSQTGGLSDFIETKVEKKAAFDLTATRQIRAFAFPIQNGVNYDNDEAPYIDITVSSPNGNWDLGTYKVNEANSPVVIGTLKTALDANNNNDNSLKKIMREGAKWMAYETENSMLANLKVADFTPKTDGITSQTHWDDLVQLINALDGAGKTNFVVQPAAGDKEAYEYVEFTLANDVKMDGHLYVPNNIKVHLNTNGHTLQIANEVEWPEGLIVDATDKIEVLNSGKLYVGAKGTESAGAEIVLDATITNDGTIYAGENASISAQGHNFLTNNKTVIVEFGAYVYPAAGQEGIIAYEMDNNEPKTIGEINTLMELESSKNQKGYAQINTLILSNNVELDLNAQARAAGEGDRYEEGSDAEYLNSLKNIDIIMRGASIICKDILNSNVNSKVKGIKVEEGTNTMTDVRPQENIVVEAEGILTIASLPQPPYNDGTEFSLNEGALISNSGKLYVKETVHTTDLWNNAETSYLEVEAGETLWYTGTFDQKLGTAKGNVLRENVDTSVDFDDLSTEAKNVATQFTEFAVAINASSFEDIYNWWEANKATAQPTYIGAMFYDYMIVWQKKVGLPALADGYTDALTVTVLQQFESVTGYKLQFTK